MKKIVVAFVLGALLSACAFAYADQPIKLIVNGKEIQCDVPPQNINGRVLVPARYVAEALGATVEWDTANNSVIITGKTEPVTQEPAPVQEPAKEGSNIQTYEKDGYTFVIEDGVEYWPAKWIDENIYEKYYGLRFNSETNTIFLAYNDKPGRPISKWETILNGIPSKVFNGRSYIPKDYYENTILPLVK